MRDVTAFAFVLTTIGYFMIYAFADWKVAVGILLVNLSSLVFQMKKKIE